MSSTLLILAGLTFAAPPTATQPAKAPPARRSAPTAAQPGRSKRHGALETLRAMNQRLATIEFADVPLRTVVEFLAELSGLNLHVRWRTLEAVGIEPDTPVGLKLKDVTLHQVLRYVLQDAGGEGIELAWQQTDNVIVITTAEDLDRQRVTRTYPVADLIVQIPQFRNAPDLFKAMGSKPASKDSKADVIFQWDDEDEDTNDDDGKTFLSRKARMARLIEIITATIEPDTWAVNGGEGTIKALGTTLVVRNSPRVHQALGGAAVLTP